MPLSLDQYHTQLGRVRDAVQGQVAGLWAALPDYRDVAVDRFVRLVVPKVRAGQVASARVTAAYLGGSLLSRDEIAAVRPVDPVTEFRRPAVDVYTALAGGGSLTDAVGSGAVRLSSLVATDLQLAVVAQSRRSLESQGHTRYRRVLTGAENCDLCLIASGNVYNSRDLLPIHGGCDCTVEAIRTGPSEPDYSLLNLSVERVKQLSEGASPESLIATRVHGELGPVLTWASDHFTGPADL